MRKIGGKHARQNHRAITTQLIEKLEQGIIPWQKSWFSGASLGEHKNGRSQKKYRGINALITAVSGYTSPNWYTFKDIQNLERRLKKGQKGTRVIFWKFRNPKEEEESEGQKFNGPLKRYYTIFNECQLEDYDNSKEIEALARGLDNNPIENAENIKNSWTDCPKIQHSSTMLSAFYSPSDDTVSMPELRFFNSSEEYYSTLFHELTHSTGHEKRLNRNTLAKINHFGDHNYSKEELVAEIGSAFLCAHAGISESVIDNQAAYIGNWLEKIKSDPKIIIEAAQKAQKAFDLIIGTSTEVESCK